MFDIKYGILIVDRDKILEGDDKLTVFQFIGYEYPPTYIDYINIAKEFEVQFDREIMLLPAHDGAIKHFSESNDYKIKYET